MKFAKAAMYGVVATTLSLLSTLWPGFVGAVLLVFSFVFWVGFIGAIVKALKPD